MRDLLFLCHRLPYPPDKGEKIRAWHVLAHLARTHRIHLGGFVDDPADAAHLPELAAQVADLYAVRIDRRWQKLRSLLRVRPGAPLSTGYFADAGLAGWVRGKLRQGIDRAYVYCSAVAPYVKGAADVHRVLDMVDVDSAKWADYAAASTWPAQLVWSREARTLLAFERRAAADFARTLFVSQAEAEGFVALAPETAARVGWFDNGVDLDRFRPGLGLPSPYPASGKVAVFTGTMDYRPNVDAVTWFADVVLPALRRRKPETRFAIVGANPAPSVQRLADRPGIIVTGRVPDVRPYIAHADVAVAPLRIARGIQNKVLEAMAMGLPVVATPQAHAGIDALPGRDLLVAEGADAFAAATAGVLEGKHAALGSAARARAEARYAWSATLANLDVLFPDHAAPAVEALSERVLT
jgi:sugar transferase (PEP-CTERM/EpsH1 system associated)